MSPIINWVGKAILAERDWSIEIDVSREFFLRGLRKSTIYSPEHSFILPSRLKRGEAYGIVDDPVVMLQVRPRFLSLSSFFGVYRLYSFYGKLLNVGDELHLVGSYRMRLLFRILTMTWGGFLVAVLFFMFFAILLLFFFAENVSHEGMRGILFVFGIGTSMLLLILGLSRILEIIVRPTRKEVFGFLTMHAASNRTPNHSVNKD